jgi:IclR family pca regulon transcriptional regulator
MTEAQTAPPAASDQYVQSLARGLAVIRAFDADHPAMTLSEVAQRTELTRATARRFLHTLVELGYVRASDRQFSLTPSVLQLGYAYLSALSLPQLAQPHLQALSALLGESTSAAVLDGGDISYVARVATRRIMSVGITVGTRFPAYATSMGRVLLAGLPTAALDEYFASHEVRPLTPAALGTEAGIRTALQDVREQGWCLLDQELELGLMSMAAPVHDAGGTVVASVNVSLQAQAVNAKADPAAFLATVREQLLRTAALVSADVAAGK